MKLKIALRAFFAIMRGTTHMYADQQYSSFVGDCDEVSDMIWDIATLFEEKSDEACEDDVLKYAKDILGNHDGN